ncbi:MAG: cache domain-containing protein [Elusimicrobia bacterium]|nr:cache domain-containing protein [Elusimicrobiota bacterium]
MASIMALFAFAGVCFFSGPSFAAETAAEYQYQETKDVVALVEDAASLVEAKGEAAFLEFKKAESRWRHGSLYVFVMDTDGLMVEHPDPALEGKEQLGLMDLNGRPIFKGLMAAAADKRRDGGWFHYQWPEPGKSFPDWKSTFAKLAAAPSGKSYLIACGAYGMKMERAFVIDKVADAAAQIERDGKAAFDRLRSTAGEFRFKDTYVFVFAPDGTELVNPGFRNLEGRNLLELKDTQGQRPIRDMIDLAKGRGSGWVDYMWPKPGDYIPAQKSSYVRKARLGDGWVVVGCGVYLEGAAKAPAPAPSADARRIIRLVQDAAALLKEKGESAFPGFRKKGSRWFDGDTYLFVWDMAGKRIFHAADPSSEGQDVHDLKDVQGRPIGRMFLDTAAGAPGEGWVHYLYPKPGDIFPTWKSTFIKRVTFPSGRDHIVGCGVYNMRIEEEFLSGAVDAAAALIEKQGRDAFPALRDKNGPFIFLDTYVFVVAADGTELVVPAFPGLEGKNMMDFKDAAGKYAVREFIQAALAKGTAWVDYMWPKPGETAPSRKHTYVRKAAHGAETFIVGAGAYPF